MQSTLIPLFENRADADAAFSITVHLGEIIERLQLMELASRQFQDAPSGLLGLLSLAHQVHDRWTDYQASIDLNEDGTFADLSQRILDLVRMDKTLSPENRAKIDALIREYYSSQ